jgi:hypothetical protein
MTWKPISELDRTQMQFVLVHMDGAQRTLLWNPAGFWEHPMPIGCQISRYDEEQISHFMELPPNPDS